MIILTVNGHLRPWQKKLIASVLNNNGVIVYPTETTYGFGADWTAAQACKRVYRLKGRPQSKDFSVIVDSLSTARQWVRVLGTASRLSRSLWPGPLTLVLPLYRHPGHINTSTLAVRRSSHVIAQQIAHILRKPLISTSANRSGNVPIRTLDDFFRQFRHSSQWPDCFVNVGALPYRLPSTILKISDSGFVMLREGKYNTKDIQSLL